MSEGGGQPRKPGPDTGGALAVTRTVPSERNEKSAAVDPAASPPPTEPPPAGEAHEAGETLGDRYRILAEVGRGAEGVVYRARDLKADTIVALKLLQHDEGSNERLPRFRRELQLARKVTHPNVVRIYDLVELPGRFGLSMELVDGEALDERLARGKLGRDALVRLAVDLARALAAAHEAGVTHRDLKPGNVLLRARDGHAVVTDFGVSRAHAGADAWIPADFRPTGGALPVTVTREGALVGTPLYMAPEQLEGPPGRRPGRGRLRVRCRGVRGRHRQAPARGRHGAAPAAAQDDRRGVPAARASPRSPEGPLRRRRSLLAGGARRALSHRRRAAGCARSSREPSAEGLARARVAAGPRAARRGRRGRGAARARPLACARAASRAPPHRASSARAAADAAAPALGLERAPCHLRRRLRGVPELHARRPRDRLRRHGRPRLVHLPPRPRARRDRAAAHPRARLGHRGHGLARRRARGLPAHRGGARRGVRGPPRRRRASAPRREGRAASELERGRRGDLGRRGGPHRFLRRDHRSPEARVPPGSAREDGRHPRAAGRRSAHRLHGRRGQRLAHRRRRPAARPRSAPLAAPAVGPGGSRRDGRRAPRARLAHHPHRRRAHGRAHRRLAADVARGRRDRGARGARAVPRRVARRLVVVQGGLSPGVDRSSRPLVPAHPRRRRRPEPDRVAAGSLRARGPVDPLRQARALDRPALGRPAAARDRHRRPARLGHRGRPRRRALRRLSVPRHGLQIGRVDGGAPLRALTTTGTDSAPAFRAGDARIVFTRHRPDGQPQLMTVPADGGEATELVGPGSDGAAPSPVDDRIAYLAGSNDTEFVPTLWDARAGTRRALSPKLAAGRYGSLTFSPDGRRLALVRGQTEIVEVDVATGAVGRSLSTPTDDQLGSPVYTPSGFTAVRVRWQGNVWMADLGPPAP